MGGGWYFRPDRFFSGKNQGKEFKKKSPPPPIIFVSSRVAVAV
jgi:hypothetical protein